MVSAQINLTPGAIVQDYRQEARSPTVPTTTGVVERGLHKAVAARCRLPLLLVLLLVCCCGATSNDMGLHPPQAVIVLQTVLLSW